MAASSRGDADADADAGSSRADDCVDLCVEAARALEELCLCKPCIKTIVYGAALEELSKALEMHSANEVAAATIAQAKTAVQTIKEAEEHFAATGHY